MTSISIRFGVLRINEVPFITYAVDGALHISVFDVLNVLDLSPDEGGLDAITDASGVVGLVPLVALEGEDANSSVGLTLPFGDVLTVLDWVEAYAGIFGRADVAELAADLRGGLRCHADWLLEQSYRAIMDEDGLDNPSDEWLAYVARTSKAQENAGGTIVPASSVDEVHDLIDNARKALPASPSGMMEIGAVQGLAAFISQRRSSLLDEEVAVLVGAAALIAERGSTKFFAAIDEAVAACDVNMKEPPALADCTVQ